MQEHDAIIVRCERAETLAELLLVLWHNVGLSGGVTAREVEAYITEKGMREELGFSGTQKWGSV